MMDSYAKEVEDFKFIPLQANLTGRDVGRARDPGKDGAAVFASGDQLNRRLRITIGVNGWLSTEEDITRPWHVFSNETEVFALRYEMRTLLGVGTAFTDLVKSAAWNTLRYQVIRHTVFATLMAALWPISVLGAASRADNPFSRGLNRSRKAGRLLADALVNRVQGERPVTLVGYSLGAAAIHACLQSLAQRRAFGLIDTVVLVGAPAPSSPEHWRTLRSVVSGKIFNVYSQNDMILGLVYRAYSMSTGAAGLQPIPRVDGLENLDLSPCVSGHLRYPDLLGEILRKCAFPGVDATDDIPMDDVMILKDEYKHGKIDDAEIDGQIRESDRLQQQQDQKEQQARELPIRPAAAGAGAAGAAGVAAGAGAVAASSDKGQDDVLPPLPRRPTEDVDVPDRPPPPYESVSTPAGIPTRKPVPPPRTGTSRTLSEPARPHTPDAPIMMIDNDYTP